MSRVDLDKIIPCTYLRRPHWGHSNRFRAWLAKFLPLQPNKFFGGEVYMLPDGTFLVDFETYRILREAIKNESRIGANRAPAV